MAKTNYTLAYLRYVSGRRATAPTLASYSYDGKPITKGRAYRIAREVEACVEASDDEG